MKPEFRKLIDYNKTFFSRILQIFKRHWDKIVVALLLLCILAGGYWYYCRYTPAGERNVRSHIVQVAQQYLGCQESDGSHRTIVDRYNAHEPRARDYEVTYEDSWCAVYTSAVALEADILGWIPLECSCEQQILLFDAQGDWVEDDGYFPKAGDYIYYDWNATGSGDCKGWSDHVGIVVQTFGPVIKVIEGNKNDDVSYRYIFIDDPFIRGFGTPDYKSISLW